MHTRIAVFGQSLGPLLRGVSRTAARTPGMVYVHLQELLPDREEWAYRFKTHGVLAFADQNDMWAWWSSTGSTLQTWPDLSQHFASTGWSGWSSKNIGLRVLSHAPDPQYTQTMNIYQFHSALAKIAQCGP